MNNFSAPICVLCVAVCVQLSENMCEIKLLGYNTAIPILCYSPYSLVILELHSNEERYAQNR